MPRKSRSAPSSKHRTWLKCLELERRDVPSRPLPYPVIYVGAETGAPPAVKAYDAETGLLTFERTAYESGFTGGVRVATADFTGDGFPDLAVAADRASAFWTARPANRFPGRSATSSLLPPTSPVELKLRPGT